MAQQIILRCGQAVRTSAPRSLVRHQTVVSTRVRCPVRPRTACSSSVSAQISCTKQSGTSIQIQVSVPMWRAPTGRSQLFASGCRGFRSVSAKQVLPETRSVMDKMAKTRSQEVHFSHLLENAPHIFGKLAALGYYRPTRVQAAAVPYLLTEKNGGLADSVEPVSKREMGQTKLCMRNCMDILVQDQTGSGKTLAFLLPLLASVSAKNDFTQAMVIVPTKELAAQIMEECRRLIKRAKKSKKDNDFTDLRVHKAIGQPNLRTSQMLTGHPPHVVIGTYQTVDSLLNNSKFACLKVDNLRHLVLDEVDFLLERFSRPSTVSILRTVHAHCRNPELQQVLVSATITPYVVQTLREFLWRPKRIETGSVIRGGLSVAQRKLGDIAEAAAISATGAPLDRDEGVELHLAPQLSHFVTMLPVGDALPTDDKVLEWKARLMPRLWAILKPKAALMFVGTQAHARMYARVWRSKGFRVGVIDGQTDKKERDKVMTRILNRTYNVLITTEMLSRGVDIPSLTHVFNIDLPGNPRQYLHRAGRVGRMKRVVTSNTPVFAKKRKRHNHPKKDGDQAAAEDDHVEETKEDREDEEEADEQRLQDVVVSMVVRRELPKLAAMTEELDLRFEMVQARGGKLNIVPYEANADLAEFFGEAEELPPETDATRTRPVYTTSGLAEEPADFFGGERGDYFEADTGTEDKVSQA